MAKKTRPGQTPINVGRSGAPCDVAANGRQVYDWRVVDGQPALVVVAVGFTVGARPGEEIESFRRRVLEFAERLPALGYTVARLTFHRREAQRRLPWAEFECATAEAGLPRTEGTGNREQGTGDEETV